MCNSLIMVTSTTNNQVLANGIVPLNTITRRRGQVLEIGSNSVVLNRAGYYKVNATITFNGAEAGVATIQLQKNGTNVVGMTASSTITTADTEVRTLSISGIVRVFCNEGIATLTLVNTGIEITTTNVEIDVEYLG